MDLQQLEKLSALKEKGVISAEEYEIEKKRILDGETPEAAPVPQQKRNTALIIVIVIIAAFLIISVLGVLSVGGIAGYSKAKSKYKINQTIDQVSMVIASIHTLFATQENYDGLNNANAMVFGIIPSDMYTSDGSALVNAYGGAVTIEISDGLKIGDKRAFMITLDNIPQDACVALLTSDWGSKKDSGIIALGVNKNAINNTSVNAARDVPGKYVVLSPASDYQAMEMCTGKVNSITWKYY